MLPDICSDESLMDLKFKLSLLELVLNADKTKVMHFSNARTKPVNTPDVITAQGKKLEVVACYKYLSIWLDN